MQTAFHSGNPLTLVLTLDSKLLLMLMLMLLTNKYIVAHESTRFGSWVDVRSLLLVKLDAEVNRALAMGC